MVEPETKTVTMTRRYETVLVGGRPTIYAQWVDEDGNTWGGVQYVGLAEGGGA